MKSMTGYGEASHQDKHAKITVQVRSLNHRHLDLQLRVPREYLGFRRGDPQELAGNRQPRTHRAFH